MAATTTTFIRIINDTEINQVGVVTSTFNIGQPGLSAYNQAVSGGYTGTFEEFTADLNSIHNKVDKVANYSLVPDTEINKLAEYPEFEDLEFSHENLTDKNSEAAVQHVDTTTVKSTLAANDKVAILDSSTNNLVLTPKSNFSGGGSQLLVDYTHTANKEVNVESIDFATSVITATAHGLANNTQLFIANKLAANVLYPTSIVPTGLKTGTVYFAIVLTENTFQLSLTSLGAAVAITDKATKDYAKFHFETKATVNIASLPDLKKCTIKTFGKCFDSAGPANYLRFKKSGVSILGATGQVWYANGGRYSGNVNARALVDLTSHADIFSAFEMKIDFSLPRAKMEMNGARMLSSTSDTANIQNTVNNAFWIHNTDGNLDFDEIELQGIFNGFNIKIYSV